MTNDRRFQREDVNGSLKEGVLKTRVFKIYDKRYKNVTELAQAMAISVGHAYHVLKGERPINQKFIVGAMRAFPGYTLDDLFYIDE